MIDAFEQTIERPQQRAIADKWYSDKKKAHTIMSQIGVDAYTGEVLDVADSILGGRQDKGYFNEFSKDLYRQITVPEEELITAK